MPINRRDYPRHWPEIRALILERDGHRCTVCRVHNYSVGYRYSNGEFGVTEQAESYKEAKQLALTGQATRGWKHTVIDLAVAHLNHDTQDNRGENLASLCQYHHQHHDRGEHQQHRAETIRRKKLRRQGELFDAMLTEAGRVSLSERDE